MTWEAIGPRQESVRDQIRREMTTDELLDLVREWLAIYDEQHGEEADQAGGDDASSPGGA